MSGYYRRVASSSFDTYTKVMGPPMVAILGYGYYQIYTNNHIEITKSVTSLNKPKEENRKVGSYSKGN